MKFSSMEDFKNYVKTKRRLDHDKRNTSKDDTGKRATVERESLDGQVHRANESRTSVKV